MIKSVFSENKQKRADGMDFRKIEQLVTEVKPIFLRRITKEQIEAKGKKDFVTQSDKEVQRYIEGNLKRMYPESEFIGEETGWHSVSFEKPCFVLDPIDGTTNYISGYNHSALSLAYIENNRTVFGIVYNPYMNDIFTATVGEGAYLNGERLFISERKTLEGSLIGFGTSPYEREKAEEVFARALRVFKKSLEVRRSGSAALDISYVAAGRLDGFFEQGLKLWDYAAAKLIAEEAGVIVTDYEGKNIEYGYQNDILACNPSIFEELKKELKQQ